MCPARITGREGDDVWGVVFQAFLCYQGFSALVVGMFWSLQNSFMDASRKCDKK